MAECNRSTGLVMNTLTDEELLGRFQDADEHAFVTLFRRRQGSVYRFCYAMCGREDWSEEVTQDVFTALIRGAQQLDPSRGTVQAWLYSVARNLVRKRLEREKRFVPYLRDEDADMEVEFADGSITSALDRLTGLERTEALNDAIQLLPSPFREVLVLCDLEECPYEAAATLLECPLGTIRSRLHRARAMLIAKLRPKVSC